ncbi:hypothetical protein EDD21DRAFT_428425 [Dissophora ornata]|nr:hypothetical protein EDD21DRAFT_428425 [Dissophora ornata]
MCLKASELKNRVFEPVVKKVLALIQGQLDGAKNVSAIFMVGGFGASTYLLDRVKQEFSSQVRTISAPYMPEVAVVCGAVYAGLNPKVVTSRITRRCCGIGMEDCFDEKIDPIELKEEVKESYFVGIYAIDGDPPRYTLPLGCPSWPQFRSQILSSHRTQSGTQWVDVEERLYFGLSEISAEVLSKAKHTPLLFGSMAKTLIRCN